MMMGAAMGTGVGLAIGFIGGSLQVLRGGAGPDGPLRLLGKYMATSGATFGFFMSIGTVIRTESDLTREQEEQVRRIARLPGGLRILNEVDARRAARAEQSWNSK
ncbi:hypothetical protein FA10DRAFT_88998 [Acaromyces ingoldii]|uniref:Mitochondrial genome maintenance protein Mgr2 n=1 Tax=Acaromyces ingoldii TaxID=215250 RepID=A0A316YTB8_9BASI|nr:hypothetical protein FA10DRAFT_88998 [Acaromyces ingoldii]PWN92286.1 hypothetical protein FA10DRAFT_88998 [Acaromyces ingoldii]